MSARPHLLHGGKYLVTLERAAELLQTNNISLIEVFVANGDLEIVKVKAPARLAPLDLAPTGERRRCLEDVTDPHVRFRRSQIDAILERPVA